MMDLAEGLKNVTVVEVKALISRNVAHATKYSHVGSNFKKFRKVVSSFLKSYRQNLFSAVHAPPDACSLS